MPNIPSPQSPAPTKKKPQTVKSALKPVAARPVTDWSSQFGTQGSVLQKNRDDDLLWDVGGSSTSANHSRPSSGRSTPLPLGGAIQIKQAPARKSGGAGGLTSDLLGGGGRKVSQEGNKKEPPKSAEVVRIETLIADVESSGEDGTELRKRALKKAKGGCFCLGESLELLATFWTLLLIVCVRVALQVACILSRSTLLSAPAAPLLSATCNSPTSLAPPAPRRSSTTQPKLAFFSSSKRNSPTSTPRRSANERGCERKRVRPPGESLAEGRSLLSLEDHPSDLPSPKFAR